MYGVNLPPQKAGQRLSARAINAARDQSERSARLTVGPGLTLAQVAGTPLLSRLDPDRQWMRVTGAPTAGAHPWVGLYAVVGGGWGVLDGLTDSDLADPVYEANGSTLPVGKVFLAEREPYTGEWRVQLELCS